MTLQVTLALSALLVEHEDLFALYEVTLYFSNNLCACNGGSTDGDVAFILYEQHLLELNGLTVFAVLNVMHEQLLASFCLELLSVDFYDCVHF